MIKYIKWNILLVIFFSIVGVFFVPFFSSDFFSKNNSQIVYADGADWSHENEGMLEQVVAPSKNNNKILDPGNSPSAVGNRIFRGAIKITLGDGFEIKQESSLLVRITMIILEVAMALWVTMCIAIGIMYAFASWDETKQKKLIWYLWNIIFGIIIALAADVIIVLIRSFSQSSIIS